MKEIILKTEHLTKKYQSFKALDDINITVYKGDVYGLIGRNGAGKTTLMKIITSLATETSGSFSLLGNQGNKEVKTKKRIGCLIENSAFFGNMTAYQNLKYYAYQRGITDLSEIDRVLNCVFFTDTKKKKFKNFSLGMKQRLGIALAILDHPDFIILDEPINGLDPIGIKELRHVFQKLNEEEGITILVSSHILSELYLVANRFCFIDHGKILKEIEKEQLDVECSKSIILKTPDIEKAVIVIENKLHTTNYKVVSQNEIRLYDYLDRSSKVNKVLIEQGIEIISLFESGLSLEEYFEVMIQEEQTC